ncbi:M48 family metalloprotease, partial [Rhizobium johnstonii]|uniref:M48 family metalloprotease n=1 Tax=Rhizobium johnstonii TaxID=3019933 RepID=UPI003F9C02DA
TVCESSVRNTAANATDARWGQLAAYTIMHNSPTELDFVVGHEFGHITQGHHNAKADLDGVTKEGEADFVGACAAALMGREFGTLKEIHRRIREAPSEYFPTYEKSLELLYAGYANCGGKVKSK